MSRGINLTVLNMRKSYGTFQSDARNVGGRTRIAEQMQSHLFNLSNVKAVLCVLPPRRIAGKMHARRFLSPTGTLRFH